MIESLTFLLNKHNNYLKVYKDDVLRQISTGVVPLMGSISKQLQQELTHHKRYLT